MCMAYCKGAISLEYMVSSNVHGLLLRGHLTGVYGLSNVHGLLLRGHLTGGDGDVPGLSQVKS